MLHGSPIIPPKLTTSERDALSAPVEGSMIYNTTAKKYQFYNGTAWGDVDTIADGTPFTTTVSSIDAKVVASTVLYTVPTGKKFYLMELNIEPTAVTGGGNGPKLSCGTNATTYNNMIIETDLKTLTETNKIYSIDAEAIIQVASAGTEIRVNNSAAATTTTYTYKAHLVGYLL